MAVNPSQDPFPSRAGDGPRTRGPRRGLVAALAAALGASSPGWADEPSAPTPAPTTASVDGAVRNLERLVEDIPNVAAERRGDLAAVVGFTRDAAERARLDRVLKAVPGAVDLTTTDAADPDRMVEIDVILVGVNDQVSTSVGFDFLSLVNLRYDLFHADNKRSGTGFAAPGTIGAVTGATQVGSLFQASVDYDVTIANAADERASVLARPHLTTLSGQRAEFLTGGEIVFQVNGIENGDVKPYPFGIQLNVTPTVLRTRAPDGREQVLLEVEAIRTSILSLLFTDDTSGDDVVFDKTRVSSKAVLPMNETLILSGVYLREYRTRDRGVPYLRAIPGLDLLFSNEAEADDVRSAVILVTPREPGWQDQRRNEEIDQFIARRRAYVKARAEGPDAIARFQGEYPDWFRPRPNRFASQLFLMNYSPIYRQVSADDLRTEGTEPGLWITDTADQAKASRRHGR